MPWTSPDDEKLSGSLDAAPVDTEQRLASLAKNITRESTFAESTTNPFFYERESDLDPNGPSFSARKWAQSILKLNLQEERRPGRTAGVAFRNLNVTGHDTSASYQKTVLTVFGSCFDILCSLFRPQNSSGVRILQEFDGLVRAGEMLVVLGPPGSGCSTLLKSLTGEIHGLDIDANSQINYQGERLIILR